MFISVNPHIKQYETRVKYLVLATYLANESGSDPVPSPPSAAVFTGHVLAMDLSEDVCV